MDFPKYVVLSNYSCTRQPDGTAVCSGTGEDDRGRKCLSVDVARYNVIDDEDISVRQLTISLTYGRNTINLEGAGIGDQSSTPVSLSAYLAVKDYPSMQAFMRNHEDDKYIIQFHEK